MAVRTPARRLTGVMALASALMIMATGCGGTDNAPGAVGGDDESGLSGPILTVAFDFTGETTVKGTAKTIPPTSNGKDEQSCADYGKGYTTDDGSTYYDLPAFLGGTTISGKNLLVTAKIGKYTGPGKSSNVSHGIEVDNRPYAHQPGATTKNVVVTNGDGSGSWEFTRLAFSTGSGTTSEGITGKVTWTCKD